MNETSSAADYDVVGLGNAIVDVLAHVEDSFLWDHDLAKGAMTLIDAGAALRLHRLLKNTVECSGGSAANSMVGLAALGGRAAYIGKVRDDELGAVFGRDIRAAKVAFSTAPAHDGPATARCLVLVTTDAQRTMQTFLGASALLGPGDVDAELIRSAKVTFLEGYLWDPPEAKEAFLAAAGIAHEAGRLVALTLSDPFCVERHRDEFLDLVDNHVDILCANEDEIVSLYRADGFAEAVAVLRGRCRWAALTRGARGAVILRGDDDPVEVPAAPVEKVVDTTGAGDLFAAGFLHGVTRDADAATCGMLGSIAAAEIIGHFGARPAEDLRARVAALLPDWS
jgi:sugar/nucleoside kinase (ribokinase family)